MYNWDTLIMANGISISVQVTQYAQDERCFLCGATKLVWSARLPTRENIAVRDPTHNPDDGSDCEHVEIDYIRFCKVCAKTIRHMLGILLEQNQ